MINPENLDLSSLPSVPLTARKELPQTPSIYFAIDSLGTIQYIGRSVNPRNRWVNHHRANQLEDNCRIAWLDCDESLLNEVEEALISFFNPPLNGFSRLQQSEKVCLIQHKGLINTISQFLSKKRKTAYQMIKETGISKTTGYKLARDPNHLPSIRVLETLCDYYKEQPSAFVVWVDKGVTND